MTETSGMVQITNRFMMVIKTLHYIAFVNVLKLLYRVEPGNFRIGRVGRAHNDYYEVALKDRYDGGEYYDDGDGDGNDGDGDR